MNEIWQGMARAIDADIPMPRLYTMSVLAQTSQPVNTSDGVGGFFSSLTANFGTSLADLIQAIVILVVGWLIALIAASVVGGILKRTNIDNQLGRWVTGRDARADSPPVEKWIASIVFWIIFIFTLVAFLQALQLTAVSEPLNNFLSQVIGYLPKLAGAAILLGIAWLIATIVKAIVTRTLDAFGIDERLGQQTTPPVDPLTPPGAIPPVGTTAAVSPAVEQFSLSDTIANALYWFIFLLFLPSVLSTLELNGTLAPVQDLLNGILSILPNVLAAILIVGAGWLLAQVVRRIVTNFLAAAGADRIGARFGLQGTRGGQSLSSIVGTLIYVLILIPIVIAALNTLQIDAISVPAIAMLNQILGALPLIFTAGLILTIAYVLGQFVSDLVTNVLSGIGFDNVFYWLGIQSTPAAPPQAPPPAQPEGVQYPGAIAPTPITTKTPSQIVGLIALIGIMLFAAVTAIDVLNIEALTTLVSGLLVIFGRILAGLIVFAIGLYFANLAFNLITSSGGRQANILGQTARISIIVFAAALGLQQIGIASDIVNLAFGLLVGAIAVAIALAFGLGGRDVAGEQLREWLASFKNR